MRVVISPHPISGTFRVPASKSHTIRRLLIAALSNGVSTIDYPLDSLDARSCVAVCRGFGASIIEERDFDAECPNPLDEDGRRLIHYTVQGVGTALTSRAEALDVDNSGTTLFLALAVAALGNAPFTFTGDEQIRRRSAAPLLAALAGLGVRTQAANNGCAPITIQGPFKGGRVSLECPTSQYLSALLLAAPLAEKDLITEIDVPLLNEKPYIELTLSYLDSQGVVYEKAPDFSFFRLYGGHSYTPMNGPVPADFSSAAFPACIAAITGGPLSLSGLDSSDAQGDKLMFEMLAQMGCVVNWTERGVSVSRNGPLRGGVFDLNATPDLLPIMAVAASYAEGETALVNVAHARIKETDRIAVMASELRKLGICCTERPDALIIQGGTVQGGEVDGHGDHRVVMALAVAALGASGPVSIDSAEAASVTYPGFLHSIAAECA
ncbi:MAG: 3-phosphoshikimate 1-carboxyvinyltransferase [Treponema sp.]|jgi:3-phosphoshikimate 1-carboxyvinyltransferase|nr:3-phosphoshikimate 1-carboxyvinyltransferase [Treponema sp.]